MSLPKSRPIRIGVIGAGIIAQSIHIPTLYRGGFRVVQVCDLSPSRADEVSKRYGVKGTTVPEDIVNSPDIDAVLIATPGSHAELTLAALAAGKHVLAEKPLALTLAEVDQIEAAARAADRVIQVGYMKMYDPLTERVRSELAELEGVRLVRVTVAHPDDLPQIQHLRMSPPVRDADTARIERAIAYEDAQSKIAIPGASASLMKFYRDVLNGSVVHELSMLRAVGLPVPTSWAAEAFPTIDEPGSASLLATGAVGDARYVLSWNWLPEYPEYDEELKVLASNGRLEYHLAKPYLLEERSRLRVERHVGTERRDTTYLQTPDTGFLRQLDAFAASINDGAPVLAGLAGVREDLISLQGIAKAIARSNGQDIITEADQASGKG
jgi:predicted dehydrogenase